MRIVLDVDPKTFTVQQGALETFRRARVSFSKAIKTVRGHGKLTVRAYVYIFDRKKPWVFNEKRTMAYRAKTRQAKHAEQQAQVVN